MNLLQIALVVIYTILTVNILRSHCQNADGLVSRNWRIRTRKSMLIVLIGILIFKGMLANCIFLIISFLFTLVSDIYFSKKNNGMGMVAFFLAYIFLIIELRPYSWDGISQTWEYIIPFLGVFMVVFYHLQRDVDSNSIKILTMFFGTVLSVAAWALVTVLYRGMPLNISLMAITAGIIIFFSDMCVAYSIFYHKFKNKFICSLENIIWSTYMIGWTILLLIVSDNNFIK